MRCTYVRSIFDFSREIVPSLHKNENGISTLKILTVKVSSENNSLQCRTFYGLIS